MRSKRKVSIKYIVFLCIIMLISIIGTLDFDFSRTVVNAKTQEKNTTKEKDRFVVDSKARFGNCARFDQSMELVTTVTNNEADFTGYVQVIMINEDYNKNIMYQADLVLAAGETKAVSQEIRWTGNSNYIMVRITDKQENTLAKKKVKVSVLGAGECLTGILSDSKQDMGYWDSDKVAYLSKEDISSSAAMGVMDVLVIDEFNTGDLGKEQYKVIKEWVEQGGTLVIGTGEQVNRTLAMFQDDYLTGRIGNAEKGIADISFQGEKIIDDMTDDMVLHRIEKGLGVICVANKSLGINKSEWKKKGYEYINAIKSQYSAVLQERLQDGDYDNYSYYGDNAVLWGKDDIPVIRNYAIVMCVYILVVTLGLYLVLKKKDKLEWTWGVIPVVGMIFAGVIIAMGSKTRISGNYMDYTKVLELQGEDNSNVKDKTYMSIASTNNSDYEMVVPEGIDVYARINGDYENNFDNEKYGDYNIGFKTKDNRNVITLKNNQTFNATQLVSESVETLKGSYQSDIRYTEAVMGGTFTNQTGLTIRNAVLWAEGTLYQLGTIKDGEKVEINRKTPSTTYNRYYGTGNDYYEILGVNTDRRKWSLEEARYMDALNEFIDYYNYDAAQGAVIYGYIDENDDSMKDNWKMTCYGVTLMKFPINIDYRSKDGNIYVPDVIKESRTINGYYYSYESTMDAEEELVVEYTLENNEHLTEISFSELLNPSINKKGEEYSVDAYEGKIEAFNWKTKKYEVIFNADKEGKITDVENYVGKSNAVRFRMNAENKEKGEIYAPVISLTKEVKKNG